LLAVKSQQEEAREALPYWINETLRLRTENEALTADNAVLLAGLIDLCTPDLDDEDRRALARSTWAHLLVDHPHPGDSLRTQVAQMEGALRGITEAYNVTPSGRARSVRQEKVFAIYDLAIEALHGGKEDGKRE
jgi:hypothetical protein